MKKIITYSLLSFFFIKKTTQLLLIIGISGYMFISCNFLEEKEKIDDNSKKATALKVVENAINSAGTIEKWKNIASLEYTKKTKLLLENGQIESEVTQRHHYVLRPNKSIKISWVVNKDTFLIVHNDFTSQKFKNDSIIEQGDNVESVVNGSLYVVGMPFKLLDKGTFLTYEGLKFLNVIDTVHTIKATYEPQKHLNHSTKDEWWYHFDKNNGAFLSSMVYHEPTYALIENLSVIKKEGLTFPGRRKSYRCDKFGKKLFLRAEFWYEDYSIKFLN
ncbi:MAG: hypothetical protein AAGC64_12500 [Bacteroidota bacterium]